LPARRNHHANQISPITGTVDERKITTSMNCVPPARTTAGWYVRSTLTAMATREEVLEVLRQVEDPELGMDIVDLGLLYEVEVEDSTAKVTYSLTSMGCPAGPLIAGDIDSAVRQVEGIENVELELTFDPPWTPDKMSDDAKFILGFG
jgi:metal-sulfur cluster biosynthetic enzyme